MFKKLNKKYINQLNTKYNRQLKQLFNFLKNEVKCVMKAKFLIKQYDEKSAYKRDSPDTEIELMAINETDAIGEFCEAHNITTNQLGFYRVEKVKA